MTIFVFIVKDIFIFRCSSMCWLKFCCCLQLFSCFYYEKKELRNELVFGASMRRSEEVEQTSSKQTKIPHEKRCEREKEKWCSVCRVEGNCIMKTQRVISTELHFTWDKPFFIRSHGLDDVMPGYEAGMQRLRISFQPLIENSCYRTFLFTFFIHFMLYLVARNKEEFSTKQNPDPTNKKRVPLKISNSTKLHNIFENLLGFSAYE